MKPFTKSLTLFTIALPSLASAEVVSLTPDNYVELTAGKAVFIKFFAPWYVNVNVSCVMCRVSKPGNG